MLRLYRLQVIPGIAYDVIGDEALALNPGATVVVQCDRYMEIGRIRSICPVEPFTDPAALERQRAERVMRRMEGEHYPRVLRIANAADLGTAQENDKLTSASFSKVRDRIDAYHLVMRLTQLHYTLDQKVLLCLFAADGRVDFRELIRDLGALFHCRIEMRQIGVRDEAALLGGIGTCGRALCCSTFLTHLVNINSQVLKQQGIFGPPQLHAGACGRLKCCMQFECDSRNEQP